MSAIFLSHSSKDNIIAEQVKAWLESQGHRSIFLDFDPGDGIPAGRNWEKELYQQLRTCRAVIVLCSEHSMASRWCFAEITHARSLGKHIFPFKVAPCSVDDLLSDLQTLDLTTEPEQAFVRLANSLRAAGIEAADPLDWDGSRPPYPGLLAFQEEDTAIFFGRDQEIGRGLDLLNQMRRYGGAGLLLVLGGSGSGKSSLMRSGMLPRLRHAPDEWLVIDPFRPGDDPLTHLAAALAAAFEDSEAAPNWQKIRDELASDRGEKLVERVRNLRLGSGHRDATVLLFIDQFEELLGHPQGHPCHRFLQQLTFALESVQAQLLAVATLRSDFLGTFQKHPTLQILRFRNLSLGPMPSERLSEIIKRPAEMGGIDLDDTLVQALLEDTKAEDALPLLAFTLRELWELWQQNPSRLVESHYRRHLGGLKGSVARAADGVLKSRPPSKVEEDSLRGAFLGMVRIDEDGHFARRTIGWGKLPKQAHEWLELFVKARLLVASGDQQSRTLEVAHEALFEAWEKLATWLDENREALLLRHELGQATRLWERGKRSDDDLWHGGRLQRALEVRNQAFDRRRTPPATDVRPRSKRPERREESTGTGGRLPVVAAELDFLAAAEQADLRARTQQQRRRWWGIAVLLVVAVVSMALFFWANRQLQLTEIQASRALAQHAYALRDRLDLSLLLAVEASKTSQTFESRTSLLSLLGSRPRLETILDQQESKIQSLAISPDGYSLAAGGDEGTLRTFDLRSGASKVLARDQRLLAMDFSPDGDQLISAGTANGDVHLWDVPSGTLRRTLTRDSCPDWNEEDDNTVWAAAFHPTRRSLATADAMGRVRVWDEPFGECWAREEGHGTAEQGRTTLAFGPEGKLLASGGVDGAVQLWDTTTGLTRGERLPDASQGRIVSIAFSPNGRIMASAGTDGRIALWDLSTRPIVRLPPEEGLQGPPAETIAFSRDGRLLASAGSDGAIRLWAPETGTLKFKLPGHSKKVSRLAFGPDNLLASGSLDQTVRLWHARSWGSAGFEVTGHSEKISTFAFDPTGRTGASGSVDKTIRVWDLKTGTLSFDPLLHDEEVLSLAYGPNGEQLAAGGAEGSVRLWNLAAQAPVEQSLEQADTVRQVWTLAFSPNGTRLVAGCAGATVHLWDLTANQPPTALPVPDILEETKKRARSVAFDPTGNRLAASLGSTLLLWDLSTCSGALDDCLGRPDVIKAENPQSEFLSLVFGSDGQTLLGGDVIGGINGGIYRWNVADVGSPQSLKRLPGHEFQTRTLLLQPGGRHLASGGGDKMILFWDLASAQRVFELRGHEQAVHALALVDGRLLSASEDATIRSWDFDNFDNFDTLRRRACRIANRNLTLPEWQQHIGPNKTYEKTCGQNWSGLPLTAIRLDEPSPPQPERH